jgi:hypothetical protein
VVVLINLGLFVGLSDSRQNILNIFFRHDPTGKCLRAFNPLGISKKSSNA